MIFKRVSVILKFLWLLLCWRVVLMVRLWVATWRYTLHIHCTFSGVTFAFKYGSESPKWLLCVCTEQNSLLIAMIDTEVTFWHLASLISATINQNNIKVARDLCLVIFTKPLSTELLSFVYLWKAALQSALEVLPCPLIVSDCY